MKNLITIIASTMIALFTMSCSSPKATYSILADTNAFTQNGESYQEKPIDILWIIDNSGSMETSQANVAQNFKAFIKEFQTLGYDFHMAVATTDSYRELITKNPSNSLLKSKILTKDTPNLETEFMKAITQGINGNGDERAFDSFVQTLKNPGNAAFLRPGSFLSVIVVSDEDDFSNSGTKDLQHNYKSPLLYPLSKYTDFLMTLTNSKENFSFSAITIQDQACLNQLNTEWPGRIVGQRYLDLATLTRGVIGSLCSNFSDSLTQISQNIIQLSTIFYLTRVPIVETIRVTIDGVSIPENAIDGWTYLTDSNGIEFHGSAIPRSGAVIYVDFDPVTIKE